MLDGNSKIIIATHVYAPGPAQEFLKYLLKHKLSKKILFIGHPLFYSEKIKGSGFDVYINSEKITSSYYSSHKMPLIVSYIYSFLLTVYFVLLNKDTYTVYVGCNNLNALAGLVLKWFGRVDKCIYYVVDYTPLRFSNPLLNYIYHYVEKLCAVYSDETWNLSNRMISARFKNSKVQGIQKVVPMGCWFDEIKKVPYNNSKKHTIVFMGHVLEKQGLQLLVKATPEIIKQIPDFHIDVIGDGPYLKVIKNLVLDMKLEKYVTFYGYVEDEKDKYSIISKCAFGFAMYDPSIASFTYYSDPGKIKTYLACGVPVLVTDVPEISVEIGNCNAGLILGYSVEDLSKKLIKVLLEEQSMKSLRNNAVSLGKVYNFDSIYSSLLKKF